MVTGSNTNPGAGEALPYVTPAKFDKLDKELGKEKVKDMLRDYFEETESAVQRQISDNPGLTRSESTEAMEVDPQDPPPKHEISPWRWSSQDLPGKHLPRTDGTGLHPVFDQQHQFTSTSHYRSTQCSSRHP